MDSPMTVIDRGQAGRLIPRFKEDCMTIVHQMDRKNSVLVLLCLNDAYENLGNAILPALLNPSIRHPQTTEQEQLALQDWVLENTVIIEEALLMVLENSSMKARTIPSLPEIEIGIDGSDPDSHMASLREKKKLGLDDLVFVGTPTLMNAFKVSQVIIMRGVNDPEVRKSLNQVFSLIISIRRVHSLEMAIKFNTTVTIEEGQPVPHIDYPTDLTPEKMQEISQRTPRLALDSEQSVPEWASDVKKASAAASLTVAEGLDSKSNQEALRRELSEFVTAYSSFLGYESSFHSRFGYSLHDFVTACQELLEIARLQFHTVYRGERTQLAKEVKRRSGLSNSKVNEIVTALTWRKGSTPFQSPIISIGSDRIFNFQHIMAGLTSTLDNHFSSSPYSNEKGVLFEERCRQLLNSKGFEVFPSRLNIVEEYLPPDISLQLWNHVKQSTDVDLIARKSNFLLICECKERKQTVGHELRLKNLFSKFKVDLKYKTLWLRTNHEKFSQLLSENWSNKLLQGRSQLWLVPLLISNLPVNTDNETKIGLLTYSELDRLADSTSTLRIARTTEGDYLSLEGISRAVPAATWVLPGEASSN